MNFILHTTWTVRPIYGGGEKGSDLLRATPPLRLEWELLGLAVPSSPRAKSSQSCATVILWSWVQIRLLPMCVTRGESLWLPRSQTPHQCLVQSLSCVRLCDPMNRSTPHDFPNQLYFDLKTTAHQDWMGSWWSGMWAVGSEVLCGAVGGPSPSPQT